MDTVKVKNILFVTIMWLLVTNQATAGFQIIYEDHAIKQMTPIQVITEAHENIRLRIELDSLSVDLSRTLEELSRANEKLHLIQSKVVILFPSGNSDFVLHPQIAKNIIIQAKLAEVVNIYGYADNSGSHITNQRISLQRAVAVKNYLIDNGIEEKKITVFAYNDQYMASNISEAGRLANRRVEIDFLPLIPD